MIGLPQLTRVNRCCIALIAGSPMLWDPIRLHEHGQRDGLVVLLDVRGVARLALRLDVDLGQGITLLAAQMETTEARPGDWVWLTLYWQADPVPAIAPEFVLELLGRNNELASKLQSYHGGGLYPEQ